MSAERQHAVNVVFSNIGKAIAAFERTLMPERSLFDSYADAIANGEATDDIPTDQVSSHAIGLAQNDPFNCLGACSDAYESDRLELRFVRNSHDMVRAFRTPSLSASVGFADGNALLRIKMLKFVFMSLNIGLVYYEFWFLEHIRSSDVLRGWPFSG